MNEKNGFTLVELMITLAIAAILLTVGIPNFRNFIYNNRLITQANKLVADAALARSTAIKYQRNTQICVSTSYNTVAPACTGGLDWGAGWIVWVDKDRDNLVDAATEVIRVSEPVSGTTTFTSGAQSAFTYNSRGFVDTGDTLTLCDDRTGETGRNITIQPSGHLNITQPACP
ncbi:MAG TPA: prepilin-type N-terminal cleavage/methylation domain-containing protein [Gammaproteobacteria bacterium]|nr:prepilin-type N-terminal cleavage/methylation domain-containing protein [Gammaproteobacteria bacterium]